MKKFLNGYIFITFCGQKIGQVLKGIDLRGPMLNAVVSQVAPIVMMPFFCTMIFLGSRNKVILLTLVAMSYFLTRKVLKKYFFEVISMGELEKRYKHISKAYRYLFFFIAILQIFCLNVGFLLLTAYIIRLNNAGWNPLKFGFW